MHHVLCLTNNKLPYLKHLICVWHCITCFLLIISFELSNSWSIYWDSHCMHEETDAQRKNHLHNVLYLLLINSRLAFKVHGFFPYLTVIIMYLQSPTSTWASLVAQRLKRLSAMRKTWVWPLGREDPLEKEMATHSSILAWRIPWTE